ARSESTRVAHGALSVESGRRVAGESRREGNGGTNAGGARGHERSRASRGVREEARLPVRTIPRRRYDSRSGNEVDRRGDGRIEQLRRRVCQGAAVRGPAPA